MHPPPTDSTPFPYTPLPPPPPPPPPLDGGSNGTSYMVLLARSETRRRIRASAGLTYLTDIVAESQDSMLHRWDNRIQNPVRVYVAPGRVANYRPGFVDAIHRAFGRWEDAGVPVRFNLDADSAAAEVRFQWRSEEHTSELQSRLHLVCRLLLEKKKKLNEKTGMTSQQCPPISVC